MDIHLPFLSSRLLRSSLPVMLAGLICGVLLVHLPAAHPFQAAAAIHTQTSISAQTTITPGLEIILEQPVLTPLAVDCTKDYWYPIPSGRDTTAYLTLNAETLANSSNSGIWRPNLPARGYYRIEAYIPIHDPIDWCTDKIGMIDSDTAQAHYTVLHALGSSEVVRSQVLPITAARWVSLGEFLLPAGTSALVRLTDLNSEDNFTRTVSFSAMRFTYLRAAPTPIHLPFITQFRENPLLPPAVVIRKGQAFDACMLPPLDKMQAWWNESPYQAYGLYLGGISYATGCTLPTPSWVAAASQQGWQFMPIWVGPQAPCYGYRNPMSYDPAVAYQQGRSEAVLAATEALNLGLADQDLSGTLIYYNLEAYGTTPTTACQAAVEAFINGWTERLHELGNSAGVYAAACASHPTDLATLPNTPEYLWVAAYYTSSYDANASVFGMPCLSDSLWSNHQRIRQYAGGHEETWGSAKLLIDSNVIDGAVLEPTLASRPAPVEEDAGTAPLLPSSTAGIQDTGWISPLEGWLVQSDRLYWSTDGGQTWLERTPSGASIRLAAFSDAEHGWALETPFSGGARLYQTQDGGAYWEALALPVTADPWQPIQMHLDATGGWIVLRRATSAAFDLAVLLRTTDGGNTWQSSDLPASGEVSFTSPNDGWLEAKQFSKWYQSSDGGRTWQPALAKAAPSAAQTAAKPAALASHAAGQIVRSGSVGDQFAWAVTRRAECTGEKLSPGFACTQADSLWLTRDGGVTWQAAALP